uniref:Uncharacterized protein n=1 Tax=Macrostomum lignano TaxID=282301 RepID=A0A1I8FBY2_9PLAT
MSSPPPAAEPPSEPDDSRQQQQQQQQQKHCCRREFHALFFGRRQSARYRQHQTEAAAAELLADPFPTKKPRSRSSASTSSSGCSCYSRGCILLAFVAIFSVIISLLLSKDDSREYLRMEPRLNGRVGSGGGGRGLVRLDRSNDDDLAGVLARIGGELSNYEIRRWYPRLIRSGRRPPRTATAWASIRCPNARFYFPYPSDESFYLPPMVMVQVVRPPRGRSFVLNCSLANSALANDSTQSKFELKKSELLGWSLILLELLFLFLVLALIVGGGVLVLLQLGDQIVDIGLGLHELVVVHAFVGVTNARRPFRLNMALNCSETRLNSSWIEVELPNEAWSCRERVSGAGEAGHEEVQPRERHHHVDSQLAQISVELTRESQGRPRRPQQVFQSKYESATVRELEQAHLRIVKQLETQNSETDFLLQEPARGNFRLELQLKEAAARATRLERGELPSRKAASRRTRRGRQDALTGTAPRAAPQELKDKDAPAGENRRASCETEKAARGSAWEDMTWRPQAGGEMEKGNEVIQEAADRAAPAAERSWSPPKPAGGESRRKCRHPTAERGADGLLGEQARLGPSGQGAQQKGGREIDRLEGLSCGGCSPAWDQISSLQKKLEESKRCCAQRQQQINESQARSAAPGAGMGAKKFDQRVALPLCRGYRPGCPLTSSAASAATASAATAAAPPIGLDSKYLHRDSGWQRLG